MRHRDSGVRGIMECLLLVLKGNQECTLVDLLKWTRVVETKYRSTQVPPPQAAVSNPRK